MRVNQAFPKSELGIERVMSRSHHRLHRQPLLQRRCTLSTLISGQQACHADVLVQIGPLNRVSTAEETPMGTFGLGGLNQPCVPSQRHRLQADIDQFRRETVD